MAEKDAPNPSGHIEQRSGFSPRTNYSDNCGAGERSSAAASDTRRAAIDRWRLGQRSSKQRDTTVPASVTVFRGSEGWNVVLQQSGDGLAAGRHGQHRRAAAGGHKSDRRKLS